MEGVLVETAEILDLFTQLAGPVREVRLTGGCTAIAVWNQMAADMLNLPVHTLRNREATLAGAAILAACGIGAFPSCAAASRAMVRRQRTFQPRSSQSSAYAGLRRRMAAIHRQLGRAGLFRGLQDPVS